MLVFFLFFLSSPVVLLVVSRSWLSAISKTAFCEEGKRNTHTHTVTHTVTHTHTHTHTVH